MSENKKPEDPKTQGEMINSVWVSINDIDEVNSNFSHKTYMDIDNGFNEYYESSKEFPKTLLFEQDGSEAMEFYTAPDGRLGIGLCGSTPYYFDANGFPFDTQKLIMTISEFPKVNAEMFKVERVSLSNKLKALWKIIDFNIKIREMPYKYTGDNGDEYKSKCLVDITMTITRVPHYYVLNVLTPLLAVMLFCFCSVFIDQDDVANRLNVCGTSLLTFLAFLVITNDKLPKFNGFNKFMIFTTANLLIISLIILWSAISKSTKANTSLDNILFGVIFSLFMMINGSFLVINYANH